MVHKSFDTTECDFSTSVKLSKRGFTNYKYGQPPYVNKWYDKKGNVVDEPTAFPIVNYARIQDWLMNHIHIYPIVHRPHPDGLLFGWVAVPTDEVNYKGDTLFRRKGRAQHFTDYDEGMIATIDRAILAVPVIKKGDDDLPF